MKNSILNCLVSMSLLSLAGCATTPSLEEVEIEAKYRVNSDLSLTFTEGKPDDMDIEAWQTTVNILPQAILKQQVSEYQVFSDGLDESLAYVNVMEDNPDKWAFGLDYEDASNPNTTEFVTTVVHEFAHIVSLETGQVQRLNDSVTGLTEVCPTLEVEEGCLLPKSYLLTFIHAFWTDVDHQDYISHSKQVTGDDKLTLQTAFYDNHSDRFVNDYSATDPMEDFAETFAFFVLSDKVDKPSSIKEEKLNFFYQYPALVDIRNQIRSNTDVRKF